VSVDSAVLSAAAHSATASFSDFDLPERLVRALERQKITVPTPVQSAVIPDALAGRDVLGRARTGSGKTLAFGLPILTRLASGRSRPKAPRALILVPTRELASQVRQAVEPLADVMGLSLATVYGGTPYDRQIKRLRRGVDIVVATPGRLDDLINRGSCRLDEVEIAVVDEADHMCDLGFYPAVDALLAQTRSGGQRLLLSATLDGDVDRLVRAHLSAPVKHELDPADDGPSTMAHHVLVTAHTAKVETATRLLEANPRSIVFTRTRDGATDLARELTAAGVGAVDMHGNLSQGARERNLRKFRSGQATVIVATDVAARGIHVDSVGMVVHYDVPNEPKAYLHRSGRTARAGASGAVVAITTPRFVDQVVRLQTAAGVEARHHDVLTAPRPMTVEALADSGSEAPASRSGSRSGSAGYGGRSGGGRSGGPSRGRSSGGYRGRNEGRSYDKRSGSRPYGARSGGRPGGPEEARTGVRRGDSSWGRTSAR
jgi:superfamily II DNA/RNA helicase